MISDQELEKLAKSVRLAVTEEESVVLKDKLNRSLEWIDLISGVDTQGVEPMYTPVETHLTMVEDRAEVQDFTGAMQNAPKAEYNYFLVPKILEE